MSRWGYAARLTVRLTLLVAGAQLLRAALEPHLLHTTRLQVPWEGLARPVRVVFLTDLHAGPFVPADRVRRWVRAALDLQPDLVLLGGDLMDRSAGHLPWLPSELAPLARAPLGAYWVEGNHDRDALGARLPAFADHLRGLGLTLLRDTWCEPTPGLRIFGLMDRSSLGEQALLSAHEQRAELARALVVAHRPALFADLPPVRLGLAGHTHGGQIRLPMWERMHLFGWIPQLPVYVSRGLGVTAWPLRWQASPELVVVDLVPPDGPAGCARPH